MIAKASDDCRIVAEKLKVENKFQTRFQNWPRSDGAI